MAYEEDNDYQLDDDDNLDEGDLIRKLRAELKKRDKEMKANQEELTSYKEKDRSSTVRNAIKEAGYNPKISAFLPKDLEPTTEAIGAWLTEYGDVFSGAKGTVEEEGEATGQPKQKFFSPEDAAQAERIASTNPTQQAPGSFVDMAQQMQSIEDPEEFLKFLQSQK